MNTCFLSSIHRAGLSALLLCALFIPVQRGIAQRVIDKDVTSFDRIEFVGRADIKLRQGSDPHVRLEASDEDDLRYFSTEVRGSTLRIEYEHDGDDWMNFAPKIEVTITYLELRHLHITGLAQLTSFDKIHHDRFKLEVEGMGNFDLGLVVESLDIVSAGTANINLSGMADEVDIVNDGTGTIDAFDLVCQRADVEVNGTGLIRINSQERLRAEANGFGASVKYRGDPKETYFDTSGFASIKADN
ncbi:MAG: head GIN domain-containing protein [Bacteroidota bacterium]